jgi:type I restriction-modification system DNA methylase subunit
MTDIRTAILQLGGDSFCRAATAFFEQALGIPLKKLTELPVPLHELLQDHHAPRHNEMVKDAYIVGIVSDAAFKPSVFAPVELDLTGAKKEIRAARQPDYEGLVIVAFDLNKRKNGLSPTRTALCDLTRSVNRAFHGHPVVAIFRYTDRNHAAITTCERTAYKTVYLDGEKPGKVSLLRDLDLDCLHAGHERILNDLRISRSGFGAVNSFRDLYAQWQKVFNTDILNERFYRDLSNWYFWALKRVNFPVYNNHDANNNELFSNSEEIRKHDAKNLIRLLTRLLFVWFIKERKLVPSELFDERFITEKLLKNFKADSSESQYYKTVLQNLFFASLNQTMGKRQFRKDGQHRNVTTLMRYKSLFQAPDLFLQMIEKTVPFMNGGLFECLDTPDTKRKGPQGGDVIIYEDGFSEHKDNQLRIPNDLFFANERTVDLSEDYGDNKKKKEKVQGLIRILNDYKFTIQENTPLDQEIALDPELLGKVFENLLASFNPETQKTARNQTGSFYTPRTIVDYMVDESLNAYFRDKLDAPPKSDLGKKLSELFGYGSVPELTIGEREAIIKAIDTCTILDPACGSGAFPMGILHKLVFILGKVDPHNELWKKRQIEKAEEIPDPDVAESAIQTINSSFADNELDYGRKLYLIENCIYGVDIQPIATQVSKLRFFISLIVDQHIDRVKDNFGIRPLPNLETRFITADTLITIDKPENGDGLFNKPEIKDLEKRLKSIRHRLFNAKTPGTKRKCREEDQLLRDDIAQRLSKQDWTDKAARQLAAWDPYDQNASAPFFEPEWMFSREEGFDIVIGNPPYIQIQSFPKPQKDRWVTQKYETYAATADIYCLFYERGAQLLKEGGHLCYITSNKWMRAKYGQKLRQFLATELNTTQVLDFGMAQNFGAATTYTNILLAEKSSGIGKTLACYATDDRTAMAEPATYFATNKVTLNGLGEDSWVVMSPQRFRIKQLVEAQGIPLANWNISINYGIKTGLNEAFYLTTEQRDAIVTKEPQAAEIIVPLLRGRFVERYGHSWDGTWMIGTYPTFNLDINDFPQIKTHLGMFRSQLEPKPADWPSGKKWPGRKAGRYKWFETQDTIAYHDEFRKPKIIYPNMTKYLPFFLDNGKEFLTNDKGFIITSDKESLPYISAVLNSRLFRCCFRDNFPELQGNTYEVRKVFIDKIPIKKADAATAAFFNPLVAYAQFAKSTEGRTRLAAASVVAAFMEEVIDACVMEVYFAEHMVKHNLSMMEHVRPLLKLFTPSMGVAEKQEIVTSFFQTANASDHPVRNRLLRLCSDSPDLLAIIKEEGKV